MIRVGYELEPGRITYWSIITFRTLRQARRHAQRLNDRGNLWGEPLPGRWVVRA
jgi:hypothetical protein